MSLKQSQIDAALDWCQYSTHPQHKMSALAFNGPRLFAGAANSLKTHPKANTYGNHLHAEIALIVGCWCSELKGATVVVSRLKKSGAIGASKPCAVCWSALRAAQVKHVIYYDEASSTWIKEKL